MILKKATQVGNPIIRRKSKKVIDVTSTKTKKVVRDLVDSMRHHGLVGMAAPQIGENLRIFVTEIRATNTRRKDKNFEIDDLRVFINPKFISVSEKMNKGWEGCGSVAESGLFAKVNRPTTVVVEALDGKGKKFKLEAKNLLARVIQHEMDHIEGIVFLDKADTKTCMSRNEYLKMQTSKN